MNGHLIDLCEMFVERTDPRRSPRVMAKTVRSVRPVPGESTDCKDDLSDDDYDMEVAAERIASAERVTAAAAARLAADEGVRLPADDDEEEMIIERMEVDDSTNQGRSPGAGKHQVTNMH